MSTFVSDRGGVSSAFAGRPFVLGRWSGSVRRRVDDVLGLPNISFTLPNRQLSSKGFWRRAFWRLP